MIYRAPLRHGPVIAQVMPLPIAPVPNTLTKRMSPSDTEAGARELAVIEDVDRELERLTAAPHADQAVDVGQAGSKRVRVVVVAFLRFTDIGRIVEHA